MTLLSGKRILIVEDEPLIAMTGEDMIIEMGGIPVGPFSMSISTVVAVTTSPIGLPAMASPMSSPPAMVATGLKAFRTLPSLPSPTGLKHWRRCWQRLSVHRAWMSASGAVG